jgi:hypothetical protein
MDLDPKLYRTVLLFLRTDPYLELTYVHIICLVIEKIDER